MKVEWKKQDKELYLPKEQPTLVTVPKMWFYTIEGQGNPNDNPDFADRLGALYTLSYTIRMMPKSGVTPPGYYEYTVYPLEGVWDLTEAGRKMETLDKNELKYKIMIRQPDFVDQAFAAQVMANTKVKKPVPKLNEVKFEAMEDGLCVQMLHVGDFDDEARSFAQMDAFLEQNGLVRRSLVHREIYLSDFRKTARDKLKTVLRYFVEKKEN